MWIFALVLFSVFVALLSYMDMRKPKNYPPGKCSIVLRLYYVC